MHSSLCDEAVSGFLDFIFHFLSKRKVINNTNDVFAALKLWFAPARLHFCRNFTAYFWICYFWLTDCAERSQPFYSAALHRLTVEKKTFFCKKMEKQAKWREILKTLTLFYQPTGHGIVLLETTSSRNRLWTILWKKRLCIKRSRAAENETVQLLHPSEAPRWKPTRSRCV